MEHLFRSYLELLQSILSNLSQLTKLVHRKIEVAQMDDLEALDEILNEEQALALAFRGLEQKRLNLLGSWICPRSRSPSCLLISRPKWRKRCAKQPPN